MSEISDDLYGWWRIVETSQWIDDGLDILGPALLPHGTAIVCGCPAFSPT